jgi:hypothetical protein
VGRGVGREHALELKSFEGWVWKRGLSLGGMKQKEKRKQKESAMAAR